LDYGSKRPEFPCQQKGAELREARGKGGRGEDDKLRRKRKADATCLKAFYTG